MAILLTQAPCYYHQLVLTATLFCSKQRLSQSSQPLNTTTLLLIKQPEFCDPSVTGLTGFHCTQLCLLSGALIICQYSCATHLNEYSLTEYLSVDIQKSMLNSLYRSINWFSLQSLIYLHVSKSHKKYTKPTIITGIILPPLIEVSNSCTIKLLCGCQWRLDYTFLITYQWRCQQVLLLMKVCFFITVLRLQLLDTEHNHFLLKSLYGLLMLLPQSDAFTTLRNRLDCVPNGRVLSSDTR